MRTFLPIRKQHGRRRTKNVAVLVLLALVFATLLYWKPPFLLDATYTVVTPFVRLGRWVSDGARNIILLMESKNVLQEENRVLSERVVMLQSELASVRAQYPEVESFINDRQKDSGIREIPAAVLRAPPLSPYDVLILDVGVKEGVVEGDLVRTAGGVALGRITEVFKNFSRAILLSSPGVKTPVRVGKDSVQVEAVGVGNGTFQIVMPRESAIEKGEAVLLPGFVPPLLGLVSSVDYQNADFLQLILFRSPVNLSALPYVIVESISSSL